MIIGARIQERLVACGLSQAELGRRVKLNQSTINGLIRGEQQSTTKLVQIARELRTSPEYLTGESNDPDGAIVDTGLTAGERELLDLFAAIPQKDKAALIQLARTIATHAASPSVHAKQHTFKIE